MTKSRKQRRAEAVERLTEMREKGYYNVYCVMSALVGEIDNEWTGDRDYADLIDLLSEDECHNTIDDNWGTFECSKCGTQWGVTHVYIGPDGTSEHDLVIPKHCPECGARVTNVCENLHRSDPDEQNRRSDDGDSGDHVTSNPQKVTFGEEPRLSDLYGIWREDKEPSLSEDKRADEQELSQEDSATMYRLGLGNVDSVQFVDESDTREKLEADLWELTLKWRDYDGNYMRVYAPVAYSQVRAMLDRQAAITAREAREAVEFAKRIERSAEERRPLDVFGVSYIPEANTDQSHGPVSTGLENETRNDTREKLEAHIAGSCWSTPMETIRGWLDRQASITESEYYEFWAGYKRRMEDELSHMRKATGEMIYELWHAYELMRAQSNCLHAHEHKFRKERDKWRAKAKQVEHMRRATADMVTELWDAYRIMVTFDSNTIGRLRTALRETDEDLSGALADAEHYKRKAKRWKRRAKGGER